MRLFILYILFLSIVGSAIAQEYRNYYQRGHIKNGVLQLQEPNGVAINSAADRIYIADTYRHRIVVLDLSGNLITTWGTYGTSGNGQFNFPRAVAVAGDGSVYVVESNGNRVQKFSSAGTFQLQFGSSGTGDGQFSFPQGIAVSPVAPNDVYVTDANNRRVQYFSSSGTFKGKWGSLGAATGQFNNPVHLAINSAGEVYVVDSNNHRVQKFSSTGTYISSIGSLGSTDGLLQFPTGVAIDASGIIYVADRTNSRVQKFNSAAPHTFLSKFGANGLANGNFYNMSAIAVDNSVPSNVYVAESSDADRLQKFSNTGVFIYAVGTGTANGLFSNPTDCVFDSDGNLFVVDNDNNRIQKFGPTGAFVTTWGTSGFGDGQFSDPQGIGVDNANPNNVYVVDGGNSRIQKFNNAGVFQLKFGSFGSGTGQFSAPRDVAVDGSGNIYVTEGTNNRVQKFTSAGAFVSPAWGGTGSSSADGFFNSPWGIAIDAGGNVLVCDANNSRIQKLTNTGTFISKWTTGSTGIRGIALDNSDNVYVADISTDAVKKYNSTGTLLLTLGSIGFNNSEFYDPSGVALLGTKVVVVDLYDRAQFLHSIATEPTGQSGGMTFASKTISSFDATFTPATGNPDKYLVLRRTGASPTGLPSDGSSYTVGTSIGNGKIVYNGVAGTFRQGGLASGTAYHFDVFAYNGADTLANYRLAFPAEANTTTNPSPFSLVKDINETLFEASGNPVAYDVGTNLLVVASDFTNGSEIWKSDGTTVGTTLLKDIAPGNISVGLSHTVMGRFGTTVVFTANDNVNGRELWKTDGTPAGTVMIKDIYPGPASSNLTFFNATNPTTNPVTMNGAIYFAANDGTNGVELWKTDGTTAGTVMVKDIAAGAESAFSTFMSSVVLNNVLYFFAYTPTTGWELWKSDGTSVGTVIVKDIKAGAANGVSFGGTPIVAIASALYFVADDGTNGAELWKSDGTLGGTVMLKDVRASGYSAISGLTVIGSNLFFSADDGINGAELWMSDGTTPGTALLKDIYTGTGSNGLPNASSPSSLTNLNGTLLFVATTAATGSELFKSDGTGPGTVLVKDIGAGGIFGIVGNSAVGVYNNELYFSGFGPNGSELWKSNGTLAGTLQVADIYPGISATGSQNGSSPTGFVVSGGVLFFSATDANGRELWKTNGTTVTQVKNFNAELTTNNSNIFAQPVSLNNDVIFAANDGVNGNELWKSDGTEAGTVMLKDINVGASSGSSTILRKVNGQVFFLGNDGTTGNELWKTDGTTANTVQVKDISSGSGSGIIFSQATRSTELNNVLYFVGSDASGGAELWKSDGSLAGTVRVKDINPGSASASPDLLAAVTANNVILFFANDGTNGVQLWKTDGSLINTIPLTTVPGGLTVSSSITRFCTLGGAYFFSATDATGTSIWRSNGVDQAGTIRLNTETSTNNYTFDGLFALNDKVVFQKINNSPAGYDELWVTDGTVAGTSKLMDFSLITTGISCLFQGVVYFRASSIKGEGAEMWRTDGTVAGTFLFKDFSPGVSGGAGSTYTSFPSRFYFNATDVTGGFWTSEGTTCSTFKMVDDPTLNNLAAQFYAEAGQRVFIFASTQDNGLELFSIDLTQLTVPQPTAITTQPVKLLKKIGDTFALTVAATGTNLSYQWLKDNTPIAGATSSTYTKTNAQVAETGLYKVNVTGTCGAVTSSEVKVDVVNPVRTNSTIPFTFGSNQTDYRMISVPLVLDDKTVSAVFVDDLGATDKTKWRLFHYNGTTHQELTSSSTIDIGVGYWLIAKNQATIDTGQGQISMDDPFLITVQQGWNQIGNPFPVDVPWSDVQAANPVAATIKLRTFEGSFADGPTLKAYSGGYFLAPANGQLKIPRGNFTGRTAAPPEIKPINADSWELLLSVKIGEVSYGLGGVGMDPAAKETEFDHLDEYNLPRFMEYVELKHPFTFTGYAASKSIVPTKKENVWEFAVESNLSAGTGSIQWEREHLGTNDRELNLVDLVNGEVIDMRRLSQYDFKMTSASHPFRVAFGDKDFVEKASLTEIERLNVSPSPFASEIMVKYSIPRAEMVTIDLMDSQGRTVNTLLQPIALAPGHYESRFTNMDTLPAGLYVVKMQAGESNVLTKIIKQ